LYNNHQIIAPVSLNFSPAHPLNSQVFARNGRLFEHVCVCGEEHQEGSECQDLHAIMSRVNSELLNFLEFVTRAAVHERWTSGAQMTNNSF